jgi:hypothetical protein
MSQDTIIHELRAIVGENYLLLEKEDVIVYEQNRSLTRCFGVAAADKNVVNEFIELTPHLDLG